VVRVALKERAVVVADGRPARWLGTGRHLVASAPWSKVEVVRFDTDAVVAVLRVEMAALAPQGELRAVALAPYERALVTRRGRAAKWLGPGDHFVWTTDPARGDGTPATQVQTFDVSGVAASPLRNDVRALVPASDYVETTAAEGTSALRFVDGALDAVLGAGRHAAWTARRKVAFTVTDLRERVLQVAGQEVMTRDRVTLRLNLAAAYRVSDVRRLATVARAPDEVLYLAVQLAVREVVATHALDELLAGREALSAAVAPPVAERARTLGLELLSFGVKDVVLPGEMKTLLNRVIEAQKEAEANVILRREETAATRSMAQTATVLAENPILVRLKELEAYKDLAAKVGQVHLVLGEGAMPQLQLKS